MRLARWLVSLVAALSVGSTASALETQARLLLSAETAVPGETVMAGIHLHMNSGWHTYWRNPGESGDATKIQWQLPDGIAAGSILWPPPEKYNFQGLFTYVYHDDVVLLVPLTLGKSIPEGPVQIKANLSWMECEELCVMGKQEVSATLTIAKTSKPSANAKLIDQWKAKLPQDGSFLQPTAKWDGPIKDDARPIMIEWSTTNTWSNPDFFPYGSKDYDVAGNTEVLSSDKGKIGLRKTVTKLEGEWPTYLPGLLVNKGAAYEVQIPIGAQQQTASLSVGALLGMLGFAFLGGLILNFMPCVLPVIALKVFSFVNQSKEHPARVRALGFVYALGVIASFLVLAGIAIAVQQTGGLATWGMALQNQIVRVLLTIVMTLVALNLFGLFEVTLGGGMMTAAGDAASREGYPGAFFNGILATVLATPCTAPFLTGALAFGFTQPPLVTALAFVAAGLGLAFPYVLLSWRPELLKFLPKPGPWMEKFKIAMGFPMLATAVWLFWITATGYGDSGVLWLGLFLVVLAAATWTYGAFYQRSLKHRGVAVAVVLLLLGAGYFGILEGQLSWRAKAVRTAGHSLKEGPDGIDWQPWSPEAVAEARAQGRPVLVDFTAKTCLNCLANKRTSIEIPSTRAKLKQINAVAFIGDFTDSDPRIASELRKFARAGVPLVLVYPKNPTAPPLVLPPILTPGIVHEALDKAAGGDLNLSAH
jgi:thiol:disulfide interchange protein DsbD